jgi:hypothetical protein
MVSTVGYGNDDTVVHSPPLLFDVATDPGEGISLNPLKYDHIIQRVTQLAAAHVATVIPVDDQLVHNDPSFALCCNILNNCVCDIEPPPPPPLHLPPHCPTHIIPPLLNNTLTSST